MIPTLLNIPHLHAYIAFIWWIHICLCNIQTGIRSISPEQRTAFKDYILPVFLLSIITTSLSYSSVLFSPPLLRCLQSCHFILSQYFHLISCCLSDSFSDIFFSCPFWSFAIFVPLSDLPFPAKFHIPSFSYCLHTSAMFDTTVTQFFLLLYKRNKLPPKMNMTENREDID